MLRIVHPSQSATYTQKNHKEKENKENDKKKWRNGITREMMN